MEHSLVKIEAAVLLLLLIASLGALFFKRLKLPFTVGLVLVGLVLGLLEPWLMPFQGLVVSHDLIIFLFVPPLVFASASNLNSRLFFRNLTPVLILAGPGLVVSMLIVGGLLAWLTPLPLGAALLFGALISATDPVAVVALFEKLGVPARLKMLVDGESMLNDATAIVAFTVVMGIIMSGSFQAATLKLALMHVVLVLVGGALVGVFLGFLMSFVMASAAANPLIQFAITLVIAYFSFLIADALKSSGVVAVLAAGLVVGRYKADLLKSEVKARLDDFWELTAALPNSLIFLLVGLTAARFFTDPQAHPPPYLWSAIFWAIVAAITARGVMIFGITPLMNPFLKQGPIDKRYQMVSFWGGLRGAVALALALSLAVDFPQRDLLIDLTLAVALFTIIVGGLTAAPLIRRFRLDQPEPMVRLEEAQARFLAQQRGEQRLKELQVWQPVFPAAFAGSDQIFSSRLHQASQDLLATWKNLSAPADLARGALWRQALQMEKLRYQEAHDDDLLSPQTFDRLNLMLNITDDAILAGRIPPPVLDFEDLEMTLERGLSRMLGWLWFEEGRGGGSAARVLKQHYEFDLVVAVVSKRVAEEIHQLSQDLAAQIDPSLFEASAAWYASRSEARFKHLQAQEDQYPELLKGIQQHIVRQAVQASAQKSLDRLFAQGIISRAILEKLTGESESNNFG